MVHDRGHHGSQHANATEFFGSGLWNLLNWVLETTGLLKVALESACIMLLGFRVRLLGLQFAWRAISIHTCCALSSSLSAPAAKSPARKRRRQACRGRRRPRHRRPHLLRSLPRRQHCHAGRSLNVSSCGQRLMYGLEIREPERAVFGTGIQRRRLFGTGIRGRLTSDHKQPGIQRRPLCTRGSREDP